MRSQTKSQALRHRFPLLHKRRSSPIRCGTQARQLRRLQTAHSASRHTAHQATPTRPTAPTAAARALRARVSLASQPCFSPQARVPPPRLWRRPPRPQQSTPLFTCTLLGAPTRTLQMRHAAALNFLEPTQARVPLVACAQLAHRLHLRQQAARKTAMRLGVHSVKQSGARGGA